MIIVLHPGCDHYLGAEGRGFKSLRPDHFLQAKRVFGAASWLDTLPTDTELSSAAAVRGYRAFSRHSMNGFMRRFEAGQPSRSLTFPVTSTMPRAWAVAASRPSMTGNGRML